MSADIILRIFLEAKPLPAPSGLGSLLRSGGCQRGERQNHNAPDPPETLTFRDGLKLSVIELVTHFNPINGSQQKLNLLQDRQGGWGSEAGLQIETGGPGL
ncbi:hypothetical protein CesoFtcFv8_017109 [Champsocephalus esox]|uniref:Uncharacterized protein n=1 Tax=Champsocephalus esox TaxID=159716 RepID=A0AAN8BIU1_9TELE|nr:hypothetical protein CesoFtcFv8_017109 [Champsocephalus esox]